LPIDDAGQDYTYSQFYNNNEDIFNSSMCFGRQPRIMCKNENIQLLNTPEEITIKYFAKIFYENIRFPWEISYKNFHIPESDCSKNLVNLQKFAKIAE
jgi:hypothetical protein